MGCNDLTNLLLLDKNFPFFLGQGKQIRGNSPNMKQEGDSTVVRMETEVGSATEGASLPEKGEPDEKMADYTMQELGDGKYEIM